MLEGLFFLSFLIGGIVSLFLAISYLSKGFDEGSKGELKRGGLFLTGAVVLLGGLLLYYMVILPNLDKRIEKRFAGSYKTTIKRDDDSNEIYILRLSTDNSFYLDSTPSINFYGIGRWNAGGIDGHFEFSDTSGRRLGWASPSSNENSKELIFNLHDKDEVIFRKVETN